MVGIKALGRHLGDEVEDETQVYSYVVCEYVCVYGLDLLMDEYVRLKWRRISWLFLFTHTRSPTHRFVKKM